VQGRKRKLDSPPPDSPSSASPDEDSSGGDGTSCTSLQLTPSKVLAFQPTFYSFLKMRDEIFNFKIFT